MVCAYHVRRPVADEGARVRPERLNRGPSWALLPLTRTPAQMRQYCSRGRKKATYSLWAGIMGPIVRPAGIEDDD